MKKSVLCSLFSVLLLAACAPQGAARYQEPMYDTVHVVDNLVIDERSVPIFPKKATLTTDTAQRFAIDLPKRCNVDWDNQRVLSVLPAEPIEIIQLDRGDDLPPFTVSDFTFEQSSVVDALKKLMAGTNVGIVEYEPIPDKISGSIKSGELSDAVELMTKMAKSYYSYDDSLRELSLQRQAKFLMKMPRDQNIIMALVDAMRGADIRGMLVNWEDKTLEFSGNYQTEREARKIVADLGAKKYMIAWDIDVYRVYPRTDIPIIWMNMMPAFGENNIKMSIPGIVGRALVVSPEINTRTLQEFLGQQSNVVLISRGTFSIPNGWQSRFDIGQCTREERLETDLIIGATGKYGDYGGMKKLDAKIALSTSRGEIASFNVPSKLGDNYVIIGIPTHSFVTTSETLISPFAELVVFMSPKIIEIAQPAAVVSVPLSGQSLRDYLDE